MSATDLERQVGTIAADCLAVRVRLLNRAVTRIFDEELRPLGLKVSQLNVLVATARMGVARPAELCEALHLEPSTLSRNAERMRARGWLEWTPEQDGRARPFRITARGKRLLARAYPAWRDAQRKARALLGADGTAALGAAAAALGFPGPEARDRRAARRPGRSR